MDFRVLPSHMDRSVNHIAPAQDGGAWEARFVQRTPEYFICYLSSHSGCDRSCRFCHLTATKQTMMTPATLEGYLLQADQVLATYRQRLEKGLEPAQRIHFNFMARGEPLANPHFLNHSQALFDALRKQSEALGLTPHFKVSSILPRTFEGDLSMILADPSAELYYSLYSLDPSFRKRWLPKAMSGEEGLDLLARFQEQTGRAVVLHWAFIAGQNDQMESVEAILDALDARGLKARFNLVRYNPHDARHGTETDEKTLHLLFRRLQERLTVPGSRIVPRVGFDVKASCGMFVENT